MELSNSSPPTRGGVFLPKRYKRILDSGEKPDIFKIKKHFNSIKKQEYPWIYDSPKDANQQSFTNLSNAFKRFFNKESEFPTEHKKGKKDSFYISNDKFQISKNAIKIPHIGWMKLTEELRFKGKIESCNISRTSNKWFVSINMDIPDYKKQRISDNIIGIDAGLKNNLVTSDNISYDFPQPLKHSLDKIKRLHRELSRKEKGSNNRYKAKQKLAKQYYKTSCIRKDYLDKITTKLCSENQAIGVESLVIKSWKNNKKWSRKVSDLGLGMGTNACRHDEVQDSALQQNLVVVDEAGMMSYS